MSTCFLKRFLPFMLTLIVGLGLGTFFRTHHKCTKYETRLYVEHNHSQTTTDAFARSYAIDSTPLIILFEPRTRMTEAARRNRTYGVVKLLVEYGVDGKARVLERITTLPDGLTEEAERIAESTQFMPQTFEGEPVPARKIQSYYFEMGQF